MEDLVSPGNLIESLIAAQASGDWTTLIALGLMVAVYLLTKAPWIPFITKKNAKWCSAIAGMLGVTGMAMLAGSSVIAAIINGVTLGATASGFWSMIGKVVLDRPPRDVE